EGQVTSAQAVARVAYRWDGDQLIGQKQYYADGSAAREVQWVYEPGSFRPLAQVEAQGDSTQLHYIVTDLTGTARELCSEEGEVRWRGEQGLWGAHREERRPIPLRRYLGDAANEEVYCELRYQGQLYDAETGLYYNRHRYYDADSGQYLSPDPIGLHGGIRPQAYVHNPLEWVDPLGLTESGCHGIEKPKKVSNSNLPHAIDRAVERGIYPDRKTASDALKDLGKEIEKNGFPAGTIRDTAHTDRVLVPTRNNGMVVYQVAKNGTAKIKTVLNAL
ncbi:RHS repeat-associated core domain-containing protein, partial [Pectobacterium versatile]|uniref:RHS repeat-associated core domain-containing protein n=1 Tax=Pectobacterium versatile TaxID=2488639 RepID=UPI001F38A0D5